MRSRSPNGRSSASPAPTASRSRARPTPAGFSCPAARRVRRLLVLPNFRVIKRYNNSDNYALAVGHLADRIRGGGPFVTPWPIDQLLTEQERMEIQALLNKRGFHVGSPDGKLGQGTREAIRAFQSSTGTAVDGQPTPDVLERLRAAN